MPIIILLIGLAILLELVKRFYRKNWSVELSADVAFQDKPVTEGDDGVLIETIQNAKRMPLPLLHVKFQVDRACDFGQEENVNISDQTYKNDIFSLMGYQQVKRTLHFTARKRGVYKIDHIDLVTSFLFYQSLHYGRMPVDTQVMIYPRCVNMPEIEAKAKQMVWASQKKSRLIVDPFAFAGIREYRPTDPMKNINWGASAKTGELMVNVYEKISGQPVVILVNLERPIGRRADEILEESIRLAVTWADILMKEGMQVTVMTTLDPEVKERPVEWDELNVRMALLDTSKKGRSFKEFIEKDIIPYIHEDVCYGLISHDELPDMQEAAEELATAAGEIWLIRPGVSDGDKVEHSGRVDVAERLVDVYEQ